MCFQKLCVGCIELIPKTLNLRQQQVDSGHFQQHSQPQLLKQVSSLLGLIGSLVSLCLNAQSIIHAQIQMLYKRGVLYCLCAEGPMVQKPPTSQLISCWLDFQKGKKNIRLFFFFNSSAIKVRLCVWTEFECVLFYRRGD